MLQGSATFGHSLNTTASADYLGSLGVAFRSDPVAMRTWDPDTGWELRRVPTGPDMVKFILRHPDEPQIYFDGECVLEETGDLTPEGWVASKIIYHIQNIDGAPRDAPDTQRQLIKEALSAFGYIYDGPSAPVEVIFEEQAEQ